MTMADLSPDKLAALEAKLRADLEAVQKVRALMEVHLGNPASTVPVAEAAPIPPPPAPAKGPVAYVPKPFTPPFSVKAQVQAVVKALKGPFKFAAVKNGLGGRLTGLPDTSIRSVLMRMIQAGELQVVVRDYGRNGCTYQKVGEATESVGDVHPPDDADPADTALPEEPGGTREG